MSCDVPPSSTLENINHQRAFRSGEKCERTRDAFIFRCETVGKDSIDCDGPAAQATVGTGGKLGTEGVSFLQY